MSCFLFSGEKPNPLQTLQQKHRNLPHFNIAVHFFCKSGVAYLEKILFGISPLHHCWMCNRITGIRISKLPCQHILLPWQQLTNDLHHVVFQKSPHFVAKIVFKFLTLYLQDQGHQNPAKHLRWRFHTIGYWLMIFLKRFTLRINLFIFQKHI